MEKLTTMNARQVGKLYGKSPYQVVYAFSKGYVPGATKLGGFMWVIDERDLPVTWPIVGRGRKKRG